MCDDDYSVLKQEIDSRLMLEISRLQRSRRRVFITTLCIVPIVWVDDCLELASHKVALNIISFKGR